MRNSARWLMKMSGASAGVSLGFSGSRDVVKTFQFPPQLDVPWGGSGTLRPGDKSGPKVCPRALPRAALPEVPPTRDKLCGNPRFHFLRAEAFKREETFARFLFLKGKIRRVRGGRWQGSVLPPYRDPGQPPLPPRSSPAPARPKGEMVSAAPGLMFQLLRWREQIAAQKLLSHGPGCLPQ